MLILQAYAHFNTMNDAQINSLEQNIIIGPPDGERSYTRESIKAAIAEFIELGKQGLRENLFAFYKKSCQFLSCWQPRATLAHVDNNLVDIAVESGS